MSSFSDNRIDEARVDNDNRKEFDRTFNEFFDPATDIHSSFYTAMTFDKKAAHIVSGASFLDLNNVILRTECNNAYETMNEEDMQRLRKLMWDVYVPDMKARLQDEVSFNDQNMTSFKSQMYIVHLSIRVAQALQLIFELNQKKSFSAVVEAAYEMVLQDVLYHPFLKGKVQPTERSKLINFLRRHPAYAAAFNTYVGYKLLRQQLVRGGGAGTNRKSNDAERFHDEAANRMWSVLQDFPSVYQDFQQSCDAYTMHWHHLYYKEVAETLYRKLSEYNPNEDGINRQRNQAEDESDHGVKVREEFLQNCQRMHDTEISKGRTVGSDATSHRGREGRGYGEIPDRGGAGALGLDGGHGMRASASRGMGRNDINSSTKSLHEQTGSSQRENDDMPRADGKSLDRKPLVINTSNVHERASTASRYESNIMTSLQESRDVVAMGTTKRFKVGDGLPAHSE
jgi:hypothetical protein